MGKILLLLMSVDAIEDTQASVMAAELPGEKMKEMVVEVTRNTVGEEGGKMKRVGDRARAVYYNQRDLLCINLPPWGPCKSLRLGTAARLAKLA